MIRIINRRSRMSRIIGWPAWIFAATYCQLQETPLMTTPGLPRVLLFGWGNDSLPYIEPPMTLFFEKALAYLARRGRRRVALIAVSRQTVTECLDPMLAQSPLTSHRLWQLPVHTRQGPEFGIRAHCHRVDDGLWRCAAGCLYHL